MRTSPRQELGVPTTTLKPLQRVLHPSGKAQCSLQPHQLLALLLDAQQPFQACPWTPLTQQINTSNQSLIRAFLRLAGKGFRRVLLPLTSDKCTLVEQLLHSITPCQKPSAQRCPSICLGWTGSSKDVINKEKREEKVRQQLVTRPASLREWNS